MKQEKACLLFLCWSCLIGLFSPTCQWILKSNIRNHCSHSDVHLHKKWVSFFPTSQATSSVNILFETFLRYVHKTSNIIWAIVRILGLGDKLPEKNVSHVWVIQWNNKIAEKNALLDECHHPAILKRLVAVVSRCLFLNPIQNLQGDH